MSDTQKDLSQDLDYLRKCHERWTKKLNRNVSDENYQDRWFDEQCLHCKYYVPLSGVFVDDWGACTNDVSPFDGRVMFEHDGCEQFVRAEWVWFVTEEEEEALYRTEVEESTR